MTDRGFDARRVALTEGRLGGLAEVGEGCGGVVGGAARVVSLSSLSGWWCGRVRRGRVCWCWAITMFPGWKAKVDGRDRCRSSGSTICFAGCGGAGCHTVVFRYQPLSWRIGWIVSPGRARRAWRSRSSSACGAGAAPPPPSHRLTVGSADRWVERVPRAGLAAAPAGRRGGADLRRSVMLLFLGPALLPGKTLSNSDTLWFEPPWVSSKPAQPQHAEQPRAGRRLEPAPAVPAGHAADVPARPALGPLHRRAGARSRRTGSRRSSRPTACPPTSCRSGPRSAGSA